MRPGEIRTAEGTVSLHGGRPIVKIRVRNTSRWAVHLSSHMHFFEVNPRLRFDRAGAFGMHLDIPSGRGVRWEPGEEREVGLVPFAGERTLFGFNRLCEGPAVEGRLAQALVVAHAKGFMEESR